MSFSYPPPVYSHQASSATGAGLVIDIGTADLAGYPPVMIISLSQGATNVSYLIEGSHDAVNWADFSGGGLDAEAAKDLVPGVRFWRTNIVSITGSLTSSVGAVPTQRGTRAVNNYIESRP